MDKNLYTDSESLAIFMPLAEDYAVELALKLTADPDEEDVNLMRADLISEIAERAELSAQPIVGDAWKNLIFELLLEGNNVFAKKSECVPLSEMGASLVAQVRRELLIIKRIADIDMTELLPDYPSMKDFAPKKIVCLNKNREELKKKLLESDDWTEILADYFLRNGSGIFGMYRAFRWLSHAEEDEKFCGVEQPDPITLADLTEYAWQREAVRRNTLKLLKGLPANNMLLYGDRGTGKSSTVKAMLNEFSEEPLRLMEVFKEDIVDLPEILSVLRNRPEKYILFIDDFSVEENESGYKTLKAILEGGIEARPQNVVLYATSNRRNLIRERFSERGPQSDDVNPEDTQAEKLSLSDRFGMKIPFLSPSKDEYLNIVRALAAKRGIEVDEAMCKKAMNWQIARSGRAAKQFVDFIAGEMGLDAEEE